MSQVVPLHVGGEVCRTDAVEAIRSPYDGSVVGEVCVGGPGEMDRAIVAADKAFAVTRRLPAHERARVLTTIARALEDQADELASLITRESGKPITFARGEVARAVITFTLGADAARRLGGELIPADLQAKGEGRLCLSARVPRGPVAAISPFNFPLNLIAHKLSPAIAVGAPLVLKPPPQCPLTALRLAEIVVDAGWPAGALSVVHCPPEVAERMVTHDRIKVLSFTGSDAVGWRLKELSGKKQVLLELGGNAPCVIDAGVDLERALPPVLTGAWAHAGQVCIKAQRLLVHASLYDEFLARFVAASREVRCGDPRDAETVVGPLIEARHVERVLRWIDEARRGGATVHCGGTAEGQVVAPTVITDARPEMRVCRDEVFGPVTVVQPFDDFGEALAACNASRYGLQAGVFTPRLDRALQAFRELDYGGVLINDVPTFRVDNYPYGGTKDSGFGREGLDSAIDAFTEPKVLILKDL